MTNPAEVIARALEKHPYTERWHYAHQADAVLAALDAAGMVIVDRDKMLHLLNIMPDTRVVQSARAMIQVSEGEK